MTQIIDSIDAIAGYVWPVAVHGRVIQWRKSMGQPAATIQEERDALRPVLETIAGLMTDARDKGARLPHAKNYVKGVIDEWIANKREVEKGIPVTWDLINYGFGEIGSSFDKIFIPLTAGAAPLAPTVPLTPAAGKQVIASGTESETTPGMITVSTGKHSPEPERVEVIKPDGTKVYSDWDKAAGVTITRVFWGSEKTATVYDDTHISSSTTGAWKVEVEVPEVPAVPPVPPVPVPVKKLVVSDFLVSPAVVAPGQGVAVTVHIKNEGTASADYSVNVTLEENGITVAGEAQTGTMAPGDREVLRWGLIAPNKEGSWRLIVYWDDEFTRTDQWVKVSKVAPPETELHKDWREFVESPDIREVPRLAVSAVIESFARAFTGYSYIDDEPAEARPGDWEAVGLIIAGATLASAGTALAAAPVAAATPAAAGAATKAGMAAAGWSKLTKVMLGLLLVSQLDVIAWGFGFAPTRTHDRIDKSIRAARSSLITLDKKVKAEEWASAKTIADTLKIQLDAIKTDMEGFDAKFWEDAGFSLDDLRATFNTLETELNSYLADHPQLRVIPTTFPEEIVVDDVQVEDGDTIMWPGHPEAQDRIRFVGIDTHEIGTPAGIEEAEYLKSLVEHQQLVIKVDPYEQLGLYGRLLGVPFLGDQNIVIAMLEHFGKPILTATKYQKKHKFVDWDELKRVAAAAVGPAVREFKISIDSTPSNAKLFIDGTYTGHLTPSNEKELKDVMDLLTPGEHTFKATKAGKEGSVTTTITEGVNPPIHITLGVAGLVPAVPEEIPPEVPPVEVPEVVEFKINIMSTPLRAKVYIDDVYTHHLTPSNEKELSDVMELLTPGKHTIKVTKAGKAAEKEVDIVEGDNGEIFLTLKVVGLPRSKEDIEKEVKAAEVLLEKLKAELAAL